MTRTMTMTLMALAIALAATPTLAQDIDCGKPVQAAQTAIDKVTDDMKGMEHMPKDQLLQIHALVDDAKMLLDGARHSCDKPQAAYDRARAIARAEAARGSAEAADVLHFYFMKDPAAMKSMPGMKDNAGPQPAAGGSMPAGHHHDMSNTKK